MIEIKQLEKTFGNNKVLEDINFKIETGEVVAIIGPSGSGKSTLLRCLNILEEPDKGSININSVLVDTKKLKSSEVYELRQQTAMVFQQYHLFRNKTALENVILSLVSNKKVEKSEAVKIGEKLLKRVGLESQANQYPITLSGGQQQRVSIARALAVKPHAILFDEPTSALDPELINEVLQVIRELALVDTTMIIVTHEMQFAKEVADRVLFMEEGKIIQQGKPEEVINPNGNPRMAKFLQQVY